MTSFDHAPGKARDDRIEEMVRHWNPPPRDQLPSDVLVKRYPMIGRTWYKRGIAYWTRRIVSLGLVALCVLFQYWMVSGLADGIRQSSRAAFGVCLAIWMVYTIATFIYWMRKYLSRRLHPERFQGTPRLSRWDRRMLRGGPALGILARTGSVLAGFILVIGALLTFGLTCVLIISLLDPVLPFEWDGRYTVARELDYAKWMDARGNKASRRERQRRKTMQGTVERGELDSKPFRP